MSIVEKISKISYDLHFKITVLMVNNLTANFGFVTQYAIILFGKCVFRTDAVFSLHLMPFFFYWKKNNTFIPVIHIHECDVSFSSKITYLPTYIFWTNEVKDVFWQNILLWRKCLTVWHEVVSIGGDVDG